MSSSSASFLSLSLEREAGCRKRDIDSLYAQRKRADHRRTAGGPSSFGDVM
jgi:hypothetical protein